MQRNQFLSEFLYSRIQNEYVNKKNEKINLKTSEPWRFSDCIRDADYVSNVNKRIEVRNPDFDKLNNLV